MYFKYHIRYLDDEFNDMTAQGLVNAEKFSTALRQVAKWYVSCENDIENISIELVSNSEAILPFSEDDLDKVVEAIKEDD